MPVVATQFHPELTRDDNIMRYLRYQEIYGGVRDPEEDPILKRMSHSEGATALLRRFVEQLADSHGRSTSDDVCSYAS